MRKSSFPKQELATEVKSLSLFFFRKVSIEWLKSRNPVDLSLTARFILYNDKEDFYVINRRIFKYMQSINENTSLLR